MEQVQQRVMSPVGVPQREDGIVGEAVGGVDVAVVASVLAVRILENERVQRSVIHRRIERFELFAGAFDVEFTQFFGPEDLSGFFQRFEILAVELCQILVGPGRSGGGNGHLHFDGFARFGDEIHPSDDMIAIGYAVAAETFGVIDNRFAVLHQARTDEGFGKLRNEIDITFGTPAVDQFESAEGRIVFDAQLRPGGLEPEHMIHVDHDERAVRSREGKFENPSVEARGHFGLDAVIEQIDPIIVGRGPFPFMAIPGAIPFIGVFMGAGDEFFLSGAGDE